MVDTSQVNEPVMRCDRCYVPGGEVTIGCRRCHAEVKIGVIELSRLHHAPLCKQCEANDEIFHIQV